MQLSIESLKAAGGFSGGLVKKTVAITTDSGEVVEFDTWIRPLSYYETVKRMDAQKNGDDILATRIANSICHEDGTPVFAYEDITGYDKDGKVLMVPDENGDMVERGGLATDVIEALSGAISEVSGLGKNKPKTPKKPSPRKKGSGTT